MKPTIQKILVANWKMNKLRADITPYFDIFSEALKTADKQTTAFIFAVPFPYLRNALECKSANESWDVCAQNMHWEAKGAFTGEVSGSMLADLGISWVILGHSERRQYFGETDETVSKKIKSAIELGINPIFCIGETKKEREDEQTFKILERQLQIGLSQINLKNIAHLVIAYEPVWAIGTGLTASLAQISEAHEFIQTYCKKQCDKTKYFILYGGSVTIQNAGSILNLKNVGGALVGGASLDPKQFFQMTGSFL
jgi:triosephosphate isomerase